jgi:RNA polymerase sigma-70 factor (ECF subfamily)
VGNVQDAEDLTTQTFLAALDGLGGYRGQAAFLTWVIGIARRKVADFFRHRPESLALDSAEMLRDTAPSPEAAAEQSLEMERLAICLTAIAPDRAEAITLKIFGGLSAAEVASVMHRSEDAVHALVSRGMRDLRQRLNEED